MESLPDHLLQHCAWKLPLPDQAIARCVCRRLRDLLAAPISFDARSRLRRLEAWLCVIGGVQERKGDLTAEMFDFTAQKWRDMPALPPNSGFNFSCAVIGYNLYVVGGFVGLSDKALMMPVYNMRTNKWKRASQMHRSREASGCGVIRDRIYVAGGFCRKDIVPKRLDSGEVYIPEKDVWYPIASMIECRSCCASAVVGDKLYIIGGYGALAMLRSVEVYDPAKDSWAQVASMPHPWLLAGCAAMGSKIYVIVSDIDFMDKHELVVFDTKLDAWSLVGSIPFSELMTGSKCSLWGCSVTSMGDSLYVLGGASSYDGGGLNTALVYNTVTDQWTAMRQMKSCRHACAAVGMHL